MNRRQQILAVLAVLPGLAWAQVQTSTAFVWWIGCAIGWILVHFRVSFSAPFRQILREGDPHAFRPIAALLALLILGTAVLLLLAPALGWTFRLTHAPITGSLVLGAFLFGVGMQAADRCGSGTLASDSRADASFALALGGLVLGVFLGSLQRPLWEQALPLRIAPIDLLQLVPLWAAVLLQLAAVGLGLFILNLACGLPFRLAAPQEHQASLRSGWPGAILLAAALLLLLVVSGEPWKVLWGLGLTGAHAAQGLGWDPATSGFWSAPARQALLASPAQWMQHEAVVVDLAVIYGAFATGLWDRRPAPGQGIKLQLHRGHLRSGLGGLLMGYGGFLAYGCNISSFVGGVMSFSLHAWVWLAAAFAGSAAWLRLTAQPTAD